MPFTVYVVAGAVPRPHVPRPRASGPPPQDAGTSIPLGSVSVPAFRTSKLPLPKTRYRKCISVLSGSEGAPSVLEPVRDA